MFLKLFGLKFVSVFLPDSRHWKWFWQRRKYGFDEREIWNLDYRIIEFIFPRLKLLRKNLVGYPPDFKTCREWEQAIDKMILAFELHNKREGYPFDWPDPKTPEEVKEKEDAKKFEEGWNLFVKYFDGLWT